MEGLALPEGEMGVQESSECSMRRWVGLEVQKATAELSGSVLSGNGEGRGIECLRIRFLQICSGVWADWLGDCGMGLPGKERREAMPNPICHFELLVPDPEKTRSFYREVFDWRFESTPGSDYELIQTGTLPGGGLMRKPEQMPVNAALQVYVLVESVEETLGRAEAAGARVIVQKTEVPEKGFFGVFQDPDGIVLGVFEPGKAPTETGEEKD